MNIAWRLFASFFKIGLFTIGGGFAMVPLIEEDIVKKHCWLTKEEFIDTLAIAQSLPGIFAANMATYIGYKISGTKGAIISVVANILPSIACILIIAIFFKQFRDIPTIEYIFMGIRPAVVALIALPALNMAKELHLGWNNFWIPILSAALISLFGVSPIIIILIAGVIGYFYGMITRKGGGNDSI